MTARSMRYLFSPLTFKKPQACAACVDGTPAEPAANGAYFSPVFQLGSFLIHSKVTVIPGLGDLAFSESLPHGTVFFRPMGAAHKTALLTVGLKLREHQFQFFLGDPAEPLGLQAGKARRVRNATAADFKDLYLPGGMAATAQLFADGPGLPVKIRCKCIDEGALAHARIAAEGTEVVP